MPLSVLKEVFGFDSFRPGQEAVIRAVLEGRDTLAVMPTGGGKSLCYQVPALMQESLTVIVSPLISLMKDQVDSLLQSAVGNAATLHSGLSPEERWEVERRVRAGEVKMLYVAPERLRSLEFVLSLKRAGVGLFVVDEAHCISEWGHNFRPDYLFLPRAIRDLGSPPVLALTATATPRVREDILRSLRLREPKVVVTSFNRPNLTYRVLGAKGKDEKLPLILNVIRAAPRGSGIVYATTRKECEELASRLRRAGIEAAAYHAGLGSEERAFVQERFMTDELPVVVATVAFGMGVDKPNVRFVIHASVPGSLPAYIQEAGRAGRDGEPSECVVLYRGADVGRRKRLVSVGAVGGEEVEDFFRALSAAGGGGRVNLAPGRLASLGGVEPDTAGILLRSLEECALISRGYDLWAEAEIRRVEEPGDLEGPVAAVHAALPGEGSVGLPELAQKAGVSPAVAQGAIYRMMVDGVVEAVPRGSLVDVRIKQQDLGGQARREISARLKAHANLAYSQIRDVEAYVSLSACRREHLLRHFGDAEEVAPCSGCDVCLGESEHAWREPETGAAREVAAGDGVAAAVDPRLFEKLKGWRSEQAKAQRVPAYVVLHNSHLEEISARKPRTVGELGAIKGVGLRRAARYGEEILALVRSEEPGANGSGPEPAEDGWRERAAPRPAGDYRGHLEKAELLLRSGRGADAVPELARALEVGGSEARRVVDGLLAPGTPGTYVVEKETE